MSDSIFAFLDDEERRVEEEAHVDLAMNTGILGLDLCLGGGLPSGMVEIFGEQSTGKTAMVGHLIHSAQSSGMDALLFTSELYDSQYMKRLGVNEDELVVVMARNLSVLHDIAIIWLVAMRRRLLVIDSLAGFRPEGEDGPGDWNEEIFRVLQNLRQAIRIGSTVVVANQVRARRTEHGYSGTESAARWVDDLFEVRLELQRKDVHEENYTMVANIVQNTIGRPQTWIELPMRKGYGIDRWLDFLRTVVRLDLVEKDGSVYRWNGEFVGRGEEEAARRLEKDNILFQNVVDSLGEIMSGRLGWD